MSDNPWEMLAPPSDRSTLSALRVDSNIRWDFFWALDTERKYLLMMRCSADSLPRNPLPKLKGIEVLTELDREASHYILIFRLLDSMQRDLFFHLCNDIVASTDDAESERIAVELALGRTWRWHHLLRGGVSDLLSQEEQKGLIGELLVLKRHLLAHLPPVDAVTSWTGPFDAPKDFEIGMACIECKARRGASTPFVTISSEFQLDGAGIDLLFLHVVDLTLAPATSIDSINLTQLATSIRDVILTTDPGAIIGFESALAALGFRWDDDYMDSRWIEGASRLYQVRDGFPRITANEMRVGVSSVRYSISLTECEPFKVDRTMLDEVLRRETNDA